MKWQCQMEYSDNKISYQAQPNQRVPHQRRDQMMLYRTNHLLLRGQVWTFRQTDPPLRELGQELMIQIALQQMMQELVRQIAPRQSQEQM
jgi:hypothetical protein